MKRFTVYDAMEARGEFEKNPANVQARDQNGYSMYKRQEYPKMMFHPEGKERITKRAEAVATPFGPQLVGEERVLISQVVNSPEEEKELKALGWHLTPVEAIRVRAEKTGEAIPEVAKDPKVEALLEKDREIERLTALLAEKNSPIGAKVVSK